MLAPTCLLSAFLLTLSLSTEALAAPPEAAAPGWAETLDRVVPGVVNLRVDATRAFDTEGASSSVATGFVVDAELGLLLTNRHVVQAGPVIAQAVLLDNEEIPVWPVYRDPIHDFGFFRYDPAQVRFMELPQLELDPRAATVGMEVRIVGSDAGEKISILSGTLARLDREAPGYGSDSYNDFNTFYIQAASGTSGGSSGSPVLDQRGRVVALNAGARNSAATSYFLPLDRVVRALELLRAGEPVTRGTLQVVWSHATYDEVRRLGLPEVDEAAVRRAFPKATGMLVVDEVVPGGPAAGQLRPGDVLWRVDGAPAMDFVTVESLLDERVGETVALSVFRGGKALDLQLAVGDLHALQPSAYLELGGGVLHELSIQEARNHSVPAKGVVITSTGAMWSNAGVPANSVIVEVDGQAMETLEEVEATMAAKADGDTVSLRLFSLSDPGRTAVFPVEIDRRWFPMQRCDRDDEAGTWRCRPSPEAPESTARLGGTATLSEGSDGPSKKLAPSLVMVDFDVPYRVEGLYGSHFRGTGLVVDADKGWVVVDRDTVPIALGDVMITFGDSLRVPGEVLWLHPVHNMAVVGYDPALIGNTPVKSATLGQGSTEPGDRVWQVGLTGRSQVVSRRTRVGRVDPLNVARPRPPFFRDMNLDTIEPEDSTPSTGGVLADRKGRVLALWASYVDLSGGGSQGNFSGMPADVVRDALGWLDTVGAEEDWLDLGVEWGVVSVADARQLGLSEEAAAIFAAPWNNRRVLQVRRRTAGSPAAEVLQDGDLLLGVGPLSTSDFRLVESLTRLPDQSLRVLRNGQELDVKVKPVALDGRGIERALIWAGAVLHAPHEPLATQWGLTREGVYVAWYWYGSPASRYRLPATRRIMSVNEQPTPDLEAFEAAVEGLPDRAPVRLLTVDLKGREQVVTLKLDDTFWPTMEIQRDADGWRTRAVD